MHPAIGKQRAPEAEPDEAARATEARDGPIASAFAAREAKVKKEDTTRLLALQTYRALSSIPTLGAASFSDFKSNGEQLCGGLLRLKLKSKDYEKEEACVKRISINLPKDLFRDANTTAAFERDMEAQFHGSFTPNRLDPIVGEKSAPGRLETIYLKEEPHPKKTGQVRRSVEVWAGQVRVFYQDVTELHGPFVTDAVYGSLDIHSISSRFVYSAEAKAEEGTEDNKSNCFKYVPSLGEKTGNTLRPTLFTCGYRAPKVVDRKIISLRQLVTGTDFENAWTLDTPVLLANAKIGEGAGHVLTATLYEEQANRGRLGVIYCTNRPSRIVAFPLGRGDDHMEEANRLQGTFDEFARDPRQERLSWRSCQVLRHGPKGHTCHMLATPEGGAHANISYLHMFNKASTGPVSFTKLTLDVSHRVFQQISQRWECAFARGIVDGIFPTATIDQPVIATPLLNSDGTRTDELSHESFLLMNGIKDFRVGCYVISLGRAESAIETPVRASFLQGIEVVATDARKKMVFKVADSATPESILLGSFDLHKLVFEDSNVSFGKTDVVTLFNGAEYLQGCLGRLLHPESGLPASHDLVCSTDDLSMKEAGRGGSTLPVVTIQRQDAVSKSQPVILMPHGGPHSCLTDWFWPSTATLALMGFRIVIPNYVGSIGGTREYVEALIGHCGTKDVQDCMKVLENLSELGSLDRNQVYISGGSHGGFLTAHLIGKYPSTFRAAQLRNPVIDIATMVATTDIPDWSHSELGIPYDINSPPAFVSLENLSKMREASPIQYVGAVQARVVIMLGLSDRRVPPSQGIQYFHALKGLGKDVEMLTFKDADHALETIDASTWTMDKTFSFFDETAREARIPWSFFREIEQASEPASVASDDDTTPF